MSYVPTTSVELTAREIQTLIAAMAGNHPESLSKYRMPVLRKLAKASRDPAPSTQEGPE